MNKNIKDIIIKKNTKITRDIYVKTEDGEIISVLPFKKIGNREYSKIDIFDDDEINKLKVDAKNNGIELVIKDTKKLTLLGNIFYTIIDIFEVLFKVLDDIIKYI